MCQALSKNPTTKKKKKKKKKEGRERGGKGRKRNCPFQKTHISTS
jgi:hypothetical protein